MAENYAGLIRNSGAQQSCIKLDDTKVNISARGEKGASEKGAKNTALLGDGNVTIEGKGNRIKAVAGRPPTEDAETIKMKAELIKVLQVPVDKIDDLVEELKDDFEVYRVDDLKELDEEDVDKMKSIGKVTKKKFKRYIKDL